MIKTFTTLFTLLLLISGNLCQAEESVKYNKVLFKSVLSEEDGKDIQVREAYFPPGWKAPRHYHNSNLFIYVVEGEFEVELAGSDKVTYRQGEALQMNSGIEMEARNPSATHSLKLAVFQVGNPDADFVVPVQ
ncbi:cupin domain-containing protein [Thalassotalea nanhaiensis]|uniref:Cupin domain-containing protein n=1 Tax=Thalassotalea nanhaiensis TaxID=3065648 RepID=A0ABY9TIM9_9GAMM|nr:cupin domain-containing protein [Colwelliaceae bacterium SQ345]